MLDIQVDSDTDDLSNQIEQNIINQIKEALTTNLSGVACETHNKLPTYSIEFSGPEKVTVKAKCCCDEFDKIIEDKIVSIF